MSLIKKSDVKNHLSLRHRSKIHLQEESPADAASVLSQESAMADPKGSDPLANKLGGASSSEPQSLPIATPGNTQD